MCEASLVRNCAPTLAGLKTASLFTCPYDSREELLESVRALNRRLGPKGLRCLPLRFSQRQALIYLYRPAMLRQDLSCAAAAALLRGRGYETDSCQVCLCQLARRLRAQGEFPHEIGLFLGYPPEDVRGFIEQGPCKCVGCWKVYGDAAAAEKTFALYRKCTQVYCRRWAEGTDIERLAVAG